MCQRNKNLLRPNEGNLIEGTVAVSTRELHSDEAIESDPLPSGQVRTVSMGSPEAGVGPWPAGGDIGTSMTS